MAKLKNKYYVIKSGNEDTIGIHEKPWSEVQKMISGVRGAVYKGFSNLEDAENWFNDVPAELQHMDIDKDTLVAYVDGSISVETGEYGCGVVLILPEGKGIEEISFSGNHPEAKSMRNVAGELSASMRAMKEAKSRGFEKLIIYHDYEGISKYITKEWRAKLKMTKAYVDWYERNIKECVQVGFKWVKGHSNNEFNELADKLAKKSVGIGV